MSHVMSVLWWFKCFFFSYVDNLCGPQCQRQHGVFFPLWSHEQGWARGWRLEQLLPEILRGKEYVWNNYIQISFTLLKRCHVLFAKITFCVLSGVWVLVRPCEQLVEEERDVFKPPLHVLWGYDWGKFVVFCGSLPTSGYFFKAGNNGTMIFARCVSRIPGGK